MIYIKFHDTDSGSILAMCDEKLINSVIEKDGIYINIMDYSDFYMGELVNETLAEKKIGGQEFYSANIIGKESIKVAVKSNIIKIQNVKTVNAIPYAHSYRIDIR